MPLRINEFVHPTTLDVDRTGSTSMATHEFPKAIGKIVLATFFFFTKTYLGSARLDPLVVGGIGSVLLPTGIFLRQINSKLQHFLGELGVVVT